MKTLNILLLLLAMIFSGFSRDSRGPGAVVTVPVKLDGVIIQDPSSETVCTPTGSPYPYIAHSRTGWLQGNASHGGRLITEQSTWIIKSCYTNFTTMINYSIIEGVNTVANGDTFSYTGTMEVDITISSHPVTLFINITGGTGRFEGVTGQVILTGFHTESGVPISGWGSMTLTKGHIK
jgi:hypothetical protein